MYAYGASSASNFGWDTATAIPRPSSCFTSSTPLITFLALVRDMARPAPWHVEEKDFSTASVVPTSTYDALPMLPGMITGWPILRYPAGMAGCPGPKARVAPLR